MADQHCRVVYITRTGDRIAGCGLPDMTESEAAMIADKFAPFARRAGGKFEVEPTAKDAPHVTAAA